MNSKFGKKKSLKEKLIIVGLGATSEQVFNFIKYYDLYDVIGFAVNFVYRNCSEYEGLPVYSLETLKEDCAETGYKLFVAVQWNHLNHDRRILYDYCKLRGFELANIISPNAVIRSRINADNLYIDDNVVVMNDVELGNDCYLKVSCVCGSNTKIADHCFLGIKSVIGGGCSVGEQSFVGMNATVFDRTVIGRKCIVGACAVVKRNMSDFSKCSISSNAILIKRYDEMEVEEKLVDSKSIR